MSDEEDYLPFGCNVVIMLTALGIIVGGFFYIRGCAETGKMQVPVQGTEIRVQNKKENTTGYEQKQGLENLVQEEKITVTTQIIDVQPRMISYEINGRERIAVYNYVHIGGGDVKEASLIIPNTAGELIKKYIPAKITYTTWKDKTMPAQEFVRRHYRKEGTVTEAAAIKADGTLELAGIQYIEDKK